MLTKYEQTEQKFDSNCKLLQDTAKLCSSQSGPISHVDDEGREWTMDCPIRSVEKARNYYYRLIAENAINGGKDSNPYYQPEEGPGHQPHNKLCCYGVSDLTLSEGASKTSMGTAWWKEQYSGLCGIQPKGDTVARSGSQNYKRWPSNYYPDGNLRMLCNMGQEDGEMQVSACDFNVLSGESPQPE